MKYVWEEKDIQHGRIVCRPLEKDQNRFIPDVWTVKWTYQIGWIGSGKKSCLICIGDGMVGQVYTPAELASKLTDDGMIPMPHSWHLATIEFLRGD